MDQEDAVAIGETRYRAGFRMMPQDANPHGNAFGGTIMRLIDEVGGVVAERHARGNVVTARIERMDFRAPVYIGDLLTFKSALIATGRTSMVVGVRVESEDLKAGTSVHTGSCYLVFVALDRNGRPRAVRPVKATNEEERKWAAFGEAIMSYRHPIDDLRRQG